MNNDNNDILFYDVPFEVREDLRFACAENNYRPIVTYRQTNHPEDMYLYRIIAKKIDEKDENTDYVVWMYNSERQALNHGVYGLDFPDALKVVADRLRNVYS